MFRLLKIFVILELLNYKHSFSYIVAQIHSCFLRLVSLKWNHWLKVFFASLFLFGILGFEFKTSSLLGKPS
jgi:hypothetical protein